MAQRGVLVESSPPRPSLVIPAGLNYLESPNKPMQQPQQHGGKSAVKPVAQSPRRETPDFVIEFTLDEDGAGRRTSRARKQVNYALPNLRDKMRREDVLAKNGLRSGSVGERSVTPDEGLVFTQQGS
jgi:Shugoshin C terminus